MYAAFGYNLRIFIIADLYKDLVLFLNIGYCLVTSVRGFNVVFLKVHIRADFLFWWFVRLVLLYVFIFLQRFAFRWNAVWLKVWCSCFCLFFFSGSLCVFYFVYTGCGIVESFLFLFLF